MRRCARGGQTRRNEWGVLFDDIIGLSKLLHCRSIRLCEAVLECCNELGKVLGRAATRNPVQSGLLPLITCSERPCYRQSGNNFDKLAPPHWACPRNRSIAGRMKVSKMRFRNQCRSWVNFDGFIRDCRQVDVRFCP
jgi:hypothetical protein